MALQLAAIDLDGTLLHDDMTISAYSRAVIREAARRIRIVVATGRMFDSAREKAKRLGLGDVPVICYTGAWVGLAESGRILRREGIPLETAARILEESRTHGWLMQSYIDDEICLPAPSAAADKTRRYRAKDAVHLGEAFYHPETEPTRLIVVEEDGARREAIRTYLAARYGSAVELVHPGDFFLDVHKKGVSKGRALRALGASWDIAPEDMVSFGNTENDASMLSLTGRSYAVANAEPEAKAAAKEILSYTNDEDGPARKLAELLHLTL